MKILFITDLIPISSTENCARALVPIIKELALDNFVDVIRPNFLLNSIIRGKTIEKTGLYNFDGIKIRNLNFHLPFLLPTKNIGINLDDYDQIIAHMPSGILFAERLIKDYKKSRPKSTLPKIFYAVHQSDITVLTDKKYSFYFKKALYTAYKNCDKILCRAPHLQEKILKIIPECFDKTIVKTSKIAPKYYITDEEMINKINAFEGIKFITAANLIKRKNVDLVLSAFASFKEHNFSLQIIGDGKELKSLKKLCKNLKLDKKVSFSGKLSHEETMTEMRKSNVFILPSENETLGLVYLEASASGCLCIGTKNTGIDGIFQDNINCFLCEPTIESLEKVLQKTFRLTKEDFKNLLLNRNIADITQN